VVRTRKRWGLLLVGAVILLLLILYPWFGCTIDRDQVQVSLGKGWAALTQGGAAAGFALNVTNSGSCDLHLEAVKVTVHAATYRDGSVEELELTETQDATSTVSPRQTRQVDFIFDHMFPMSPTQLSLRVEMSFREVGTILVFDGQLQIPVRA